jgi:hypothetical protein
VHDDLYEPVMPATTGGRRYFLLLVNDTTHYMWVVLLAAKSDAASANKRIQAAVKNECGRKLQVLRKSSWRPLAVYCADERAVRHFSATYTPQKRGGAAESSSGGDGAGASQAEGCRRSSRRGRGHRSLSTEPAPNEEPCRVYAI